MKTRALVMAGVMALTIFATTRVAQAQQSMVVNVPYDFVAGNKTLPAGEYTVKVSTPTNSVILVSRKDSTTSAFINTNPAVSSTPQAESKLIFNRYGDRYFLSQVWQQGYAQGRQLLKSPREKELALTANLETEGQVILVAELPRTNR
ncbi:MAG TPA: hypothetical protein VN087_04755 [Verrucomicrobiae bacterium]|jgi:hypothetical protein|nr:hypothetical protein [Verrucomicrobiae bacterium]